MIISFFIILYISRDIIIIPIAFLAISLYFLILTLVIYFEYYQLNKDDTICINEDNGDIIYQNDKTKIKIKTNIEDIKLIEQYRFILIEENWMPYKQYFHYVLHIDSGKKIIVSSLLLPSLLQKKLELFYHKFKVKKRKWPYTPLYS